MLAQVKQTASCGVVVALLGALTVVSAAEAPTSTPQNLNSQQRAQLDQLEEQLHHALREGKFERVVEVAREVASLRLRWQGAKHWETIDARIDAEDYKRLVSIPAKDRLEVAKSFRVLVQAEELREQGKYAAALRLDREALAIRRKVLGEEHAGPAAELGRLGASHGYRSLLLGNCTDSCQRAEISLS
jgi:hypothetical protein